MKPVIENKKEKRFDAKICASKKKLDMFYIHVANAIKFIYMSACVKTNSGKQQLYDAQVNLWVFFSFFL